MKDLKDCKVIDSGFDNIIKSDYITYVIDYQELKTLVRSWYTDKSLESFDTTNLYEHQLKDTSKILEKKIGLLTNLFLAFQEGDKYFLLDGFKRLLTDYQIIDINSNVYIKVLTTKLSEDKIMSLMFELNAWKLDNSFITHGNAANKLFDRGWSLLLDAKFGIKLYRGDNEHYRDRKKDVTDFDLLNYYCMSENKDYSYPMGLGSLWSLFKNPRIIDDLNELFISNNWTYNEKFKNQEMFIQGYAMFLSKERLKKNFNDLPYEFYLNEFKNDKKSFNKITGMSGNDSTRKNIYDFFQNYASKLVV